MPHRLVGRLLTLLLTVASLVGGLVIVEVGLRMRPSSGKSYMGGDPVFHHRLKPSVRARAMGVEIATNAHGMRNREIGPRVPGGPFRVLLLGDSFTEGQGLEVADTMGAALESMLNGGACRRAFEVINAGVASYSPILEYVLLERVGLALEPDLVLLNFDMTDVHDDLIRTALAVLDQDGLPLAVPDDRRREAALLLPPIAKPSLLRVLDPLERRANHLLLYQELRRSSIGAALFGPVRLTAERMAALGLTGNVQYDIEAITRDEETPETRAAWRLTERYISGIFRRSHERRIAFALVVYPHAQQVAADESPEGRRRHALGPGLFASDRPFRTLAALGQREGFAVIDLLGLFRARHTPGDPLFRHDDIHHTRRGARVFAEGVFAGLVDHALVPCARPGARRDRPSATSGAR